MRQLVPGSDVAGNWAFTGANTVVRTPEVAGQRGSVTIAAPAEGGRIAPQPAYAVFSFGIDTDVARLQIAAANTRAPLSWFGVEAWYKHALGQNPLGRLHLLAGLGWHGLEVKAQRNGRLALAEPVPIGGGKWLRNGDAFSYEATASRESWLLGVGVQQTLWTDWLYAFATAQLAISHDNREREALRIALRRPDGSALETLDVFQDDRFDRTVQQSGRVSTSLEPPLVLVALGLGMALPPFRVIVRPERVDRSADSDYPAARGAAFPLAAAPVVPLGVAQ